MIRTNIPHVWNESLWGLWIPFAITVTWEGRTQFAARLNKRCSILHRSNVSSSVSNKIQISISTYKVSKIIYNRLSITHFFLLTFSSCKHEEDFHSIHLLLYLLEDAPREALSTSRPNHILYWMVNWYFACFSRDEKFMMQFNEFWLRKWALERSWFRFASRFIGSCKTLNWIFNLIYAAVVMEMSSSQLVPKMRWKIEGVGASNLATLNETSASTSLWTPSLLSSIFTHFPSNPIKQSWLGRHFMN